MLHQIANLAAKKLANLVDIICRGAVAADICDFRQSDPMDRYLCGELLQGKSLAVLVLPVRH